jgi:enamine deaminase RidA (YjgF/YER057c/UK114 family)
MSRFEVIDPVALGRPRGYSNGLLAPAGGRVLFVAGQVGWNERQQLVGEGFAAQFEQALSNVLAVVREAGGAPSDLGRLTLYVVDKREYQATLAEVGAAYRRLMGNHFPAMALLEVSGLLEPGARVEIEGTAVLAAEAKR